MDKALKQRLVGASVLVALAVVILPMLLGGRPDSPQEAQPIEIPPRPAELSFETRRFPIGEQEEGQPSVLPERDPAAPDATGAEAAPADGAGVNPEPETLQERLERVAAESPANNAPEGATEAPPEVATVEIPATSDPAIDPATAAASEAADEVPDGGADLATNEDGQDQAPEAEAPAPEPVVESPAEPAQVTAPAPGETAPEGRYVVQVASFSSTSNANRLAGNLRESGMPVLMDTVDSAAGTLHRVRVGPFDQQAEADQVLARLARQVPDVRPRIVDLRPTEEAPVARAEDPLVRWSVQVGVFSESANAEKLVFQLRDAGFRAQSRREANTERTVYRVLVGPEVSRDDAIRSRDRIEASQGIRGIVQSTD